jgi:hypothetical protein
MEAITANLSDKIRKAHKDGKDYLVASASLINPGVLAGSDGPLYYSPEETARNHKQWDKIPLTLYHPFDGWKHVSAQHPGILEKQGIGFVARPRIGALNRKLQTEAWFDIDRTRELHPETLAKLERGEPIELSTGLFVDKVPALPGATHNGRGYEHHATNFRADHVAVLPDQIGACAIKDGCGILVNREGEQTMTLRNQHQGGGGCCGGG